MPFTEYETARIETAMSDFMIKRRPPLEIRDKLDLAYRIEGQSVSDFLHTAVLARPQRDGSVWKSLSFNSPIPQQGELLKRLGAPRCRCGHAASG